MQDEKQISISAYFHFSHLVAVVVVPGGCGVECGVVNNQSQGIMAANPSPPPGFSHHSSNDSFLFILVRCRFMLEKEVEEGVGFEIIFMDFGKLG